MHTVEYANTADGAGLEVAMSLSTEKGRLAEWLVK